MWAAVHGAVSLELAGHFPDPAAGADRFRSLTSAAILPFHPGPPAAPDTKEALAWPWPRS